MSNFGTYKTVLQSYALSGRAFSGSYQDAISASAVVEFLITTPASLSIELDILVAITSGVAKIELFEDSTTSDDGSSMTLVNYRRSSANAASTVLTASPTITDAGDLLVVRQACETEKAKLFFVGLKAETKYLLRLTEIKNVASELNALFTIIES